MFRKLSITIGLIALVAAPCHGADKAFSYKGVRLGASEAVFLKAHPFFTCADDYGARTCKLIRSSCPVGSDACVEAASYGGVPADRAVAVFENGALTSITIGVWPSRLTSLYEALIARWGQPKSHVHDVDEDAWTWTLGPSVLTLTSGASASGPAYANVLVITKMAYDAAAAKTRKRKSAAARDL